MKTTIVITFLSLINLCFSQNLNFINANLKSLLLSENCVDINGDELGDSIIDLNNDGEIQTSEANLVENLVIYSPTLIVTSIFDLHQFTKLKRLTIKGDIGLIEISNLNLDSLVHIRISDHNSISNIDLSDLPNLEAIFIEGLNGLNSLNLQNGSSASQNFSLFYTYFNIACVDSIVSEYNLVAQHLLNGNLPSINCTLGVTEQPGNSITIYPNPSIDKIYIKTDLIVTKVLIQNMTGEMVYKGTLLEKKISVKDFERGFYILTIETKNGLNYRRLISLK